ncbi:MAG: hypothetical protein ACR2FN_10290 [Chitinophagaceae bacterium]
MPHLGNYPVQIISARAFCNIDTVAPIFDTIHFEPYSFETALNDYIVKGIAGVETFQSINNMDNNSIYNINYRGYFFFITGFVNYQNLITKKIKTYKFQMRTTPKPNQTVRSLINDNY